MLRQGAAVETVTMVGVLTAHGRIISTARRRPFYHGLLVGGDRRWTTGDVRLVGLTGCLGVELGSYGFARRSILE